MYGDERNIHGAYGLGFHKHWNAFNMGHMTFKAKSLQASFGMIEEGSGGSVGCSRYAGQVELL